MSTRKSRILAALCGILGVVALGFYFAAPPPLPPADATSAQVTEFAAGYHNKLLLGAWLQATGTLLAVVFFIALVHMSGAATRLAGMIAIFASAVLLSVGLLEGTLLIGVVQATANGHPETALTSYDLQGQFIHVFPIGPAPAVFLSLGAVLLGSSLLPRALGYLALALGVAFEVVGFAGLFVAAANIGVIFLLIGQELWILAAAITLAVRARRSEVATAQADGG